jgi:hypothetical protein
MHSVVVSKPHEKKKQAVTLRYTTCREGLKEQQQAPACADDLSVTQVTARSPQMNRQVVSRFSKFGDRATARMKLAKLQPLATEACHFGAWLEGHGTPITPNLCV